MDVELSLGAPPSYPCPSGQCNNFADFLVCLSNSLGATSLKSQRQNNPFDTNPVTYAPSTTGAVERQFIYHIWTTDTASAGANGHISDGALRFDGTTPISNLDGPLVGTSYYNSLVSIPPSAGWAADQILLRASQQPELTGMTAQASHLAVNGRSVPKGALKIAGRVYVPVQAFAKAMGLTSGWDAKTGALTLSGPKRKTVALTAGSTAATVGGALAAALAVPVLKDGGEPVMALADLLRLTGGRITGHAGNTVQVKG